MRTDKQKAASRANGRKSRGPVTPEGKLRARENALKHGHLAQTVLLPCESPAAFQDTLDSFLEEFNPQSAHQSACLQEMVVAVWRRFRTWFVENAMFTDALAPHLHLPSGEAMRAALATLAAKPEYALLNRYETRISRTYYRAHLGLLRSLGSQTPNEPTPDLTPSPATQNTHENLLQFPRPDPPEPHPPQPAAASSSPPAPISPSTTPGTTPQPPHTTTALKKGGPRRDPNHIHAMSIRHSINSKENYEQLGLSARSERRLSEGQPGPLRPGDEGLRPLRSLRL